MNIERIDRYYIRLDGYKVLANERQERAIRNMTPEQRRDFLAVMGHKETP